MLSALIITSLRQWLKNLFLPFKYLLPEKEKEKCCDTLFAIVVCVINTSCDIAVKCSVNVASTKLKNKSKKSFSLRKEYCGAEKKIINFATLDCCAISFYVRE